MKISNVQFFAIICIGLLFAGAGIISTSSNVWSNISPESCLDGDQTASYQILDNSTRPGDAQILVKTQSASSSVKTISTKILQPDHYYPIEIRRCGFYAVHGINYDSTKTAQSSGYREEIWKTDYSGRNTSVTLLAEKNKDFVGYYSRDFRVSPNEKYIALIQGYLGKDNFALVIRDIKEQKDIFLLPLAKIVAENPEHGGNIGFLQTAPYYGWTEDGRFFWAITNDGAYIRSYIRIDSSDWSYKVFDAPDRAMGGDPLNTELGLVTFTPGAQWTGMDIMDEQVSAELKAEGYINRIYLRNLFTSEDTLLAEVSKDHPLWWSEPEWIDITTLKYILPGTSSPVERIYKVPVEQ